MIYVTTIKPASSGFGQFEKSVDGCTFSEFDSAEEYVEQVARNNDLVQSCAYDPDIADMGDEDGERLAVAIREATGAVLGGHGTIVAFLIGDEVFLESVNVATTQQISISMDQVWAGSGRLVNGKIVDCGAQFCDDADESEAVYELIEDAITEGKDEIKVEIEDRDHVITWSLT